MKNRLTNTKRAALEIRAKRLRAYLEPDKISGIVDKVSPDQVDIKSVLDSIIKVMEGAPDSTSIKEKKAYLQMALLKAAADVNDPMPEDNDDASHGMPPKPPMGGPMDGNSDPNQMLSEIQNLEPEFQGYDDAKLMQYIKQLEDQLMQDAGNSPDGAPTDAPMPPAGGPPGAPDSMPPIDAPDNEEDSHMPKLAPEHRMALLMSLPAEAKARKVANLRALADALSGIPEDEVSNDKHMSGHPNDSLAESFEYSEGKEPHVNLNQMALLGKVEQLIRYAEETEEEAAEDGHEAKASAAVVNLALRNLYASLQQEAEFPWQKDEDKDDDDDKDDEDDKDDFLKDKKAILKARLASMRREATVDGKTQKVPKDFPKEDGTTEDELHGDAKIQYQNALGGTHMSEIQTKRQKIPTDKQVAGNEEPNELYMSSKSVPENEKMTSERDSSKDVSTKRTLSDNQSATQSSNPSSPDQQMERGNAGSHQNSKDWDATKKEVDKTPKGDRLVGLASVEELIQARTSRAMNLVSKMASANMIRTEAHFHEQVVKLAAMDDERFSAVASVFESTAPALPSKRAGEIPPQFKEHVNGPEFKAHEGDPDDEKYPFEEDEEEDSRREASRKTRRVATANQERNGPIRKISELTNNNDYTGIRNPLHMGVNESAASRSSLGEKLASLNWSNAYDAARNKSREMEELFPTPR